MEPRPETAKRFGLSSHKPRRFSHGRHTVARSRPRQRRGRRDAHRRATSLASARSPSAAPRRRRVALHPLRPPSRSMAQHSHIRLRAPERDAAFVEGKVTASKGLGNLGIGADGSCGPGHQVEGSAVFHSQDKLLAPSRVAPSGVTAGGVLWTSDQRVA
jgi:hypothetical protein